MATEVTGNTAEQQAKGEMQGKGGKPGKHPKKPFEGREGSKGLFHVVANKSKAPWEGRKV